MIESKRLSQVSEREGFARVLDHQRQDFPSGRTRSRDRDAAVWPKCLCGHHAVYHDLPGELGKLNPHLDDWHEVAWTIDTRGGLLTGHCSGTVSTACSCTLYRPVEAEEVPIPSVRVAIPPERTWG
jgi:hypothetical protein